MVNKLSAFQPGQLGALANQLNAGFGGGVKDWKADLRGTYDPTKIKPFNWGGGNGGGNGNGGGKPDPRNPGGGGPNQPGDGGFEPSRPRNAMMPNRPMQMQMPQQGLLNGAMQQQPQQGLLGDVPDFVLSYLNSRR